MENPDIMCLLAWCNIKYTASAIKYFALKLLHTNPSSLQSRSNFQFIGGNTRLGRTSYNERKLTYLQCTHNISILQDNIQTLQKINVMKKCERIKRNWRDRTIKNNTWISSGHSLKQKTMKDTFETTREIWIS